MASDIKLSISEDDRLGVGQKFLYHSDNDNEDPGSGEFYSFEHTDLERLGVDLTATELKIRESNEELNVDINRNDVSDKSATRLHESSTSVNNGEAESIGSVSNSRSVGSVSSSGGKYSPEDSRKSASPEGDDEVDRSYHSYTDSQRSGEGADHDHHYYEPHRQYHRLSVCHTGDEFSSDEDEAFVELLEKANHIVGSSILQINASLWEYFVIYRSRGDRISLLLHVLFCLWKIYMLRKWKLCTCSWVVQVIFLLFYV